MSTRTQNTKRNIIFSYIDTILTTLFQFVVRIVIVTVLGSEYLGLSSLFVSILQVLNMADLGFAGAIVYNMYKPLAENDTAAVCSLLKYYKKVYRRVSIVVLTLGLAVTPFLPSLIKSTYPENVNIYFLYFLYLANTVSSYMFFAYKTALLNAVQRMDITKKIYSLVNVLQYLLQLTSLWFFKSYYMYVGVMVVGTIVKNVVVSCVSKKMFPQYICSGDISTETKRDIISRVRGLLVCSISSVTYTTFDSIIISYFIGLKSVAIYNNYLLVYNGLITFVALLRHSMQSSIGNSVAIETKEKNYRDMLLWQFIFSVIAIWCVTCMFSLYQPFMYYWMGEGMLLSSINVILLCILFYVSVIQNSINLYLTGNGLWWELRWPYILSTLTNLLLNIVLGKYFGVTGIIFSTLFSTFVFGLLWGCKIIVKKYFSKSMREFYFKQFSYTLVCLFSCGIVFLINSKIHFSGVSGIILNGCVCTFVAIGSIIILLSKTNEFILAKNLFIRLLKKSD